MRAHRQSLTEDARYDDFPREHDEEEEQNCVEDAVRIIGRISNHPEIRQEKRCHQGQGEETLGEPVVENHGQAVKSPLHRGPVHGAAAAPGSGMSLPRRLYLHRLDLIHQRRGTVQVSSSGRASVTGSQVAWTPAPSRELQRPHLHVVFLKKIGMGVEKVVVLEVKIGFVTVGDCRLTSLLRSKMRSLQAKMAI